MTGHESATVATRIVTAASQAAESGATGTELEVRPRRPSQSSPDSELPEVALPGVRGGPGHESRAGPAGGGSLSNLKCGLRPGTGPGPGLFTSHSGGLGVQVSPAHTSTSLRVTSNLWHDRRRLVFGLMMLGCMMIRNTIITDSEKVSDHSG